MEDDMTIFEWREHALSHLSARRWSRSTEAVIDYLATTGGGRYDDIAHAELVGFSESTFRRVLAKLAQAGLVARRRTRYASEISLIDPLDSTLVVSTQVTVLTWARARSGGDTGGSSSQEGSAVAVVRTYVGESRTVTYESTSTSKSNPAEIPSQPQSFAAHHPGLIDPEVARAAREARARRETDAAAMHDAPILTTLATGITEGREALTP
jgi:hypothetical protein